MWWQTNTNGGSISFLGDLPAIGNYFQPNSNGLDEPFLPSSIPRRQRRLRPIYFS